MAAGTNRFEKHARTALILLWAVTFIAGVAVLEWALSPGGGRYRASGLNPGPGPARHRTGPQTMQRRQRASNDA